MAECNQLTPLPFTGLIIIWTSQNNAFDLELHLQHMHNCNHCPSQPASITPRPRWGGSHVCCNLTPLTDRTHPQQQTQASSQCNSQHDFPVISIWLTSTVLRGFANEQCRVTLAAQTPITIKLSLGRFVGLSFRTCVGLSSALWKMVDRIRMPFGVIGRLSRGMRQVVGLGIGPWEGVFLWAYLGRAIVTNGDFTAYVCDSAATRPSSQITLGELVCGVAYRTVWLNICKCSSVV